MDSRVGFVDIPIRKQLKKLWRFEAKHEEGRVERLNEATDAYFKAMADKHPPFNRKEAIGLYRQYIR